MFKHVGRSLRLSCSQHHSTRRGRTVAKHERPTVPESLDHWLAEVFAGLSGFAGFLKRLDVTERLEGLGIRLEPIAGESPWQIGKHSKHIHTLKENMNLLRMELRGQISPEELVGLSISAKNNPHNVRGFSPNQWAFGQGHSRVASFLQQSEHLPSSSARDNQTFEEALQNETKAQRLFLEIDSRKRVQRALRAQSRPIRDFECGELVYYYRNGRKEGSRYGDIGMGRLGCCVRRKRGPWGARRQDRWCG